MRRKANAAVSDGYEQTKGGFDVIIVGAGTVGASLAVKLGKSGKRVALVDKSFSLQHRIIGEYLQPAGFRCLQRLGLDECVTKNIGAVPSAGYLLVVPEGIDAEGGGSLGSVEGVPVLEPQQTSLYYPDRDPATWKEMMGFLEANQNQGRECERQRSDAETETTVTSSLGRSGLSERPSHQQDREKGEKSDSLSYGGTFAEAAARRAAETGSPIGFAYHNGRFVQELRKHAAACGNVTLLEASVKKLKIRREGETERVVGVELDKSVHEATEEVDWGGILGFGAEAAIHAKGPVPGDPQAACLSAPLTVVCDGGQPSGFALRKEVRRGGPVRLSTWAGVLLNHESMRPPVPSAGHGHVVLATPSPVLIYQISPTETRVLVCVDDHGSAHLPSGSGGDAPSSGAVYSYLRDVVAPQLPEETRGPFRELLASSADGTAGASSIISLKNSYSLTPADDARLAGRKGSSLAVGREGVLMLGDALNLRHALTGCGMTVGLRDVENLSDLLTRDGKGIPVETRKIESEFLRRRCPYASTLNTLANALHQVFAPPGGDRARARIRTACFRYLSNGGVCAAGPMGLLSGLCEKPWVLSTHFFLVVVFALRDFCLERGMGAVSPSALRDIYQMLHAGARILLPLLIKERTAPFAWWPTRKALNVVFPFEDLM